MLRASVSGFPATWVDAISASVSTKTVKDQIHALSKLQG